jgi:RNA polymerase sigma factor (sigma-70 family)
LLSKGEHATLLGAYYPIIRQRCLIRVRGDAAEDVAQDVCLRLASELRRGKRYSVPFRVVVHQQVDWAIREHVSSVSTDLPIPIGWDVESPNEPYAEFEADYTLEQLFDNLSIADREVATMRYRQSLEINDIAAALGKERNAIDQALWRIHRRLSTAVIPGRNPKAESA